MATSSRTDPLPSVSASNEAQISDLVRRNRTLEHIKKELAQELAAEKERSKEAVLEYQKQWHEQERLMRTECESLLSCYRFVQLRTVSELESERLNVLNEQQMLRAEKLLRLQRDFRVTTFYARERELEEKIVELEEELENMAAERMELASVLRKKLALIVGEVRSRDTRIESLISERADIEKDVSKLREENVQLQATLSSTSSKLERINLQFEGSQSSRQELESQNDELKRRNHDLQRQLDKWQRLEGKGETELESLRKQKIEADTEMKELRDKLRKAGESENLLEREKRRVEHVKGTALQWQKEAEDANKRLADAQEELERLLSEQQNARNATSRPSKSASKKPPPSDSEGEYEVAERRKARRQRGTTPASEAESVLEIPNPRAKGVKKPRSKVISPIVEEEDLEDLQAEESPRGDEVSEEKESTKQPRARSKGKAKAIEIIDDEGASPVKLKRKRKAFADPDDVESDQPNKKAAKTTKKPGNTQAGDIEKKLGSTSKGSEDRANVGSDLAPKPKRKKTLFAGSQPSQPMSFNFAPTSDGGFNIPTSLLPVEEADGPVPKRTITSTFSNIMGPVINTRMTKPKS
ncbi:hypothetical protein Agabi119p4_5924 [Agaricus bisporus var. burnettii]|uniref:Uncharacterized protein n=1 Tax=Agaricus bisporus var. burnettii TaxID=192524 RepID=A0A8H7KD04_AGABI|nr:hypothetical protein Agabi119p4_5924 [Agaricus bisporus var. burnettii]